MNNTARQSRAFSRTDQSFLGTWWLLKQRKRSAALYGFKSHHHLRSAK